MNRWEAMFQDDWRKVAENRGWVTRKLHGNEYQPGLPDIVAACKGRIYLLEFKWNKFMRPYWVESVMGTLRGPQTGVLRLFASRDAPVFVVMGQKGHDMFAWPGDEPKTTLKVLDMVQMCEFMERWPHDQGGRFL